MDLKLKVECQGYFEGTFSYGRFSNKDWVENVVFLAYLLDDCLALEKFEF